jgi:hypothetical protein
VLEQNALGSLPSLANETQFIKSFPIQVKKVPFAYLFACIRRTATLQTGLKKFDITFSFGIGSFNSVIEKGDRIEFNVVWK